MGPRRKKKEPEEEMPRGLASAMSVMKAAAHMPIPWAVDYLRFIHDITLSDQSIRLYVQKGRIKSVRGPKNEVLVVRDSLDEFAAAYKTEKKR